MVDDLDLFRMNKSEKLYVMSAGDWSKCAKDRCIYSRQCWMHEGTGGEMMVSP
ncbi:hypothetical protein SP19_158 [Salmonella phage 19]|nr:hypothetical protein SP19_158 [Salmonella phage 19]